MTLDMVSQHLAGLTSLACAGALSFIVLTRKVREGVVIKAGLIMMIGALLATGLLSYQSNVSMRGLWNASMLLRVGMLLTLAGYVRRVNQEMKAKK